MPLGEPREILDDARGIRPEVMRAVFVNENPSLIVFILGIAADVSTLLNDRAAGPILIGKSLRQGEPRETRPDD
jgi:hypothetical protein